MKKMALVFVVLLFAAFVGTANAGVGNNPNSFVVEMTCGDEIVEVTVPVISGLGAKVTGGGIAVARTHYIDFNFSGTFEPDELVASNLHGQGIKTVFCTWHWDRDTFLHGMDIQFVPPK